MSDTNKRTGSCLCGAIKITAQNTNSQVGACHCSMCRKWSGGPFMAFNCNSDVSFEGEENISIFKSSDWAERGFCKKCGTSLFYKLKKNGTYMMTPGLFDEGAPLDFTHQIFIEEKPTFYDFKNETKNLTGEDIFSQNN